MERLVKKCSLHGALAQLGERGLCKPEVRGSIPLSSTMNLDAGLRAGVFAYTAFVVFFAGRLAPLRPML